MRPTGTTQRQWRVLLPLGLATLLSLAGDLTLYAVLPAQAVALGLSMGALGFILSANRLVRLLSNPVAGLLLDRCGRRRLFLCGMALGTLSTLGYLQLQRPGLLLAARLLWGISWSLIYVGGYSMLVDITTRGDRGRASGVLQVFYFAGLSLHPLLGGLLADRFGFQAAIAACALLTGLGLAIALLALPETRSDRLPSEAGELGQRAPRRRYSSRFVYARRAIQATGWLVRQPQSLAASYLYMLASFAGDGIVMSTISLYLKQRYGEAALFGSLSWPIATLGGALLAIRALVSGLVAPWAGHLSDRAASRWAVTECGVILGVAGMGLLALASEPLPLVLSVCLVALSGSFLTTVLPALVGDLGGREQSGAVLGALMTAGDIGCAVAPLAVYQLAASLPLQRVYIISALLLATGLGLPWLASRTSLAARTRMSTMEE